MQLRWPKTASTGRYRLNRKWKYGLAIFVVLALNCQSTDENRTRISQLTTEILQRKHGPTLRNYCTPQNFQRPLLKNINGDPMLSVPFYTADWKAYHLAKATK